MSDQREDVNAELGAVELRKQEFRSRYKDANNLVETAKIMASVQRTQERLKEELAVVNAEFDVLRLEVIPGMMEQQGIESLKVEGLGRLGLTGDMYVHIKPGMKDKLFKWLRARKMGALVTEAVNSSTLKSFVKGRMKDGKELPSEFLNVTPFTRASITKG